MTAALCLLQRRPSSKAQFVQGLHRTEAYYPNTTIKQLRQPSWQLLLSRIGDSLMLHLLMHVTIFVPLPNGCYLQVNGLPAAQVMFAPGFLLLKQEFAAGMTLHIDLQAGSQQARLLVASACYSTCQLCSCTSRRHMHQTLLLDCWQLPLVLARCSITSQNTAILLFAQAMCCAT